MISYLVSMFLKFVDLFLHLDKYLGTVIQSYGNWTYLILFVIVFCETGLVITPVLPGDSLLFAVGAFCALGYLGVWKTLTLLSIAAVLGDTVNYWIGSRLGPKVFQYENSGVFKKEYLEKTRRFYERYGGKTIIIARFVPIVRTFAPFIAGVGAMSYGKFLFYNVAGGLLWVFSLTLAGYYFGNIPVVKNNFTMVIMGIIAVSMLPGILGYLRHKKTGATAR